MIALLLLVAAAQGEAASPAIPPEVLAYHSCVVGAANDAEAGTKQAAAKPAPNQIFDVAEAKCQPLYAPALTAFYATTMKTEEVQAYIRGKDEKQVRIEVEAGLRSSLKERVLQNISLLRGEPVGNDDAQN